MFSRTKNMILLDRMFANRYRSIEKSPLMRIVINIYFGHGDLSNDSIENDIFSTEMEFVIVNNWRFLYKE
jgi:hypothetical protein